MEAYSRFLRGIENCGACNAEAVTRAVEFMSHGMIRKSKWCSSKLDDSLSIFPVRVLTCLITQSILSSSTMALLQWFTRPSGGLENGFTRMVQLIRSDDKVQVEFGCLILDRVTEKLPKEYIRRLIHEAVQLEKEIFTGKSSHKYIFIR